MTDGGYALFSVGEFAPKLEQAIPIGIATFSYLFTNSKGKESFYIVNLCRCPYCQKVWLQLEEKQIPYTLEKINMRCYGPKPPSYTAIVSLATVSIVVGLA